MSYGKSCAAESQKNSDQYLEPFFPLQDAEMWIESVKILLRISKYIDSSLSLLDDYFDYDIHFNSTSFAAIAVTKVKMPVNLKSPSLQSAEKIGQLSRVPDPSIALQAPQSYHN